MERIETEFVLILRDFRQASYYGMFVRSRKAFQIMLCVLVGIAVYVISSMLGFGEMNPVVAFIGVAYLIWLLLLFGRLERQRHAHMKSPESLIGQTYRFKITEKLFEVEMPQKKANFVTPVTKLVCAFELSSLFMLYTIAKQTYLLPNRALTAEQRVWLRGLLRRKLKENFSTRFEKKN